MDLQVAFQTEVAEEIRQKQSDVVQAGEKDRDTRRSQEMPELLAVSDTQMGPAERGKVVVVDPHSATGWCASGGKC